MGEIEGNHYAERRHNEIEGNHTRHAGESRSSKKKYRRRKGMVGAIKYEFVTEFMSIEANDWISTINAYFIMLPDFTGNRKFSNHVPPLVSVSESGSQKYLKSQKLEIRILLNTEIQNNRFFFTYTNLYWCTKLMQNYRTYMIVLIKWHNAHKLSQLRLWRKKEKVNCKIVV